MKQRIVDIIGSGISGMATAYYLSKAEKNIKIRVWEKGELSGGLAANFKIGGFEIERFYHHLFTRDIALISLIEDLGLSSSLKWKPAKVGSYYANESFRLSTPLDVLKFKPLPFFDRIRLGIMTLHARTIKDWHSLDDISVKEYIIKYGGKKVWEIVWEPLFRGKFGDYVDNISAAWFWSKMVDRGGSRNKAGSEVLGYVQNGLGSIMKKIIQELEKEGHEFHFNTDIKNLEIIDKKIVSFEYGDNLKVETDLVISAIQVPDLVKILPKELDLTKSLNEIKFLANVCLVLVTNKSLSDYYWSNITDLHIPFVGIIENTKLTGIDDYENKNIIYISSYVLQNDPRLAMDAEALFNLYEPYLKKIFPDFSQDIVKEKYIWTASSAQPIVHKGYRHAKPAIETEIENLYICTMAQIYPNDRQISNGIEQAKKTVATVLNTINK